MGDQDGGVQVWLQKNLRWASWVPPLALGLTEDPGPISNSPCSVCCLSPGLAAHLDTQVREESVIFPGWVVASLAWGCKSDFQRCGFKGRRCRTELGLGRQILLGTPEVGSLSLSVRWSE